MFFKQIAIGFIILSILGYFFGDRLFYFQATMMMRWQYEMPAYDAYERIVKYYPDSPYVHEARKMMDILIERRPDLRHYLDKKNKVLRKKEAERERKRSFH